MLTHFRNMCVTDVLMLLSRVLGLIDILSDVRA